MYTECKKGVEMSNKIAPSKFSSLTVQLFKAIFNSDLNKIDELITRGVDINQGIRDVINFLIDRGADIDIKNNLGETLLDKINYKIQTFKGHYKN